MQYMGGKQRIARQIATFLQPHVNKGVLYGEPFVGSANVMSLVNHRWRVAADANDALITLWRALQSGWEPPSELDEATYARLQAAKDPRDPLTAFAGFGCSFGGKWFGGYARGHGGRNGYAATACRGLQRKLATLLDVDFWSVDFLRFPYVSAGAVLYCDPPYAGTTAFEAVAPFDHTLFWDWVRNARNRGATVFVSEFDAPPDFEPVLIIKQGNDMRKASGEKTRTETVWRQR